MYKPLQCGCCDEYAKYLEENGFKVNVESVPDRQFEIVKRMAEVPERFYGCHTLAVDGYTVEGLVPIETITKLLTEKPKIRGISLPGMPVGAPGMPGRQNARSEEHTSELQSLMRISYAVFCLKKKKNQTY